MERYHKIKLARAGFTLVELIIVVVIVATLAAVAISRYLNISRRANIATLEAMGGAIESAASMVYAKAAMAGLQNIQNTTIAINPYTTVEIRYGYPSASRNNGISKLMGGNFANNWTWSTSYGDRTFWLTTSKLGGRSGVYVNNTAVKNSGCYILYDHAAAAGEKPTISYVTTDC